MRRTVALSLLAALFLVFTGAGLANAAPPRGVVTLTVVDHGTPENSAVLDLTFTNPASERQIRDAVAQIGGDPNSVVVNGQAATASMESAEQMAPMAGPAPGQALPCGSGNTWGDSQGLFYLQHNCGQTTVQWAWTMNSNLRPSVVGLLSERGMDWWRNDVKQPRQAPHLNFATNYRFHGTFSGSPTGTRLSYHDEIRYRHNIAGGGNALITIGGSFRYY